MPENPLFDLTLHEKWERLYANLQAWEQRGLEIENQRAAYLAKYGIDVWDAQSPTADVQISERVNIIVQGTAHFTELDALEIVKNALKQHSRVPGVRGFLGRLLGRGYWPMSHVGKCPNIGS